MSKKVFLNCNDKGKPVHKAKEIFKKEKMADINSNLEGAFGDSLKNKFDEYSDFDSEIEIEAMLEAKKLKDYVATEKMERLNNRTLFVHSQTGNDFRFQATLVRFIRPNGETCKAEFSVPLNFNGPIRLWTEDLSGKKVWSTMEKIEEGECNPDLLFDFLGKYTHRFTALHFEDLPF